MKSKAKMGARVQYCGHAGWFIADVFEVAGACVVRASGPVSGESVIREELETCTHHLVDFPSAGFWNPRIGVFVVPESQVKLLKAKPLPPIPKLSKPEARMKALEILATGRRSGAEYDFTREGK